MATIKPTETTKEPRIVLPLWVKDYSGILITGLLFFLFIFINTGVFNNGEVQRTELQILSTIGVGIIVASGLNLVIGYIGQVALGHAALVTLGGYVLGLLVGRIPGEVNWIDFLSVRVDNAGKPLAYNDRIVREAAWSNTQNLLFILLIVFIGLTVILGGLLFWRYSHVRKTGGKTEAHFWQNPAAMRMVSRTFWIGGGVIALAIYILTIVTGRKSVTGEDITDIPWILFAVVLTITIVLGYLSQIGYNNARTFEGGIRPSFWDRPSWVGKMLAWTVGLGLVLIVADFCLMSFSFQILQNFWAAIILGAIVTGFFGYILALPALRVKGPYLSMVTIAFGLGIYELASSVTLRPVLGSQSGMNRIPFPTSARDPIKQVIDQPSDRPAANGELVIMVIIIGIAVVITLYIIRSFMRSRWGRSLIALRENEIGAASVGINVTRMKTLAFVMSATLAGVAGVLNSYALSFIGPNLAVLQESVKYVTMIILGGVGILFGPVVGAVIIGLIPNILRRLDETKADNLFDMVSYIAPWLLLALLVAYFATRKNTSESLKQIARYVFALVVVAFGAITVINSGISFDDKARVWTYITFVSGAVLIITLLVWGWGYTRNRNVSDIFGTTLGMVVLFNSIEVFRAVLLALGASKGVGIKQQDLGIVNILLVVLYVVLFIAAVVYTPKEVRRLTIRSIAIGFIVAIPGIYTLIIGLLNPNAPAFKPSLVELTLYGAILLFFIYLVPKGAGGLIGNFVEHYFPTKNGIDRSLIRGHNQSASADAGIPDQAATGPTLAFHREKGTHAEVLKIARVTRDFKGLRAVDSVEMLLKRGDIHALIGPNGAGKTTLLNLISGLYAVSSGQILYKGERLDGLKPHQIANVGISRTFQNLQVFGDMTVIQNVMVGFHLHTKEGFWASLFGLPSVRREEKRIEAYAMELLEFVGLGDRAYDKAKDLPYGYQRLLEIARGLAVEPEILLLDEPAAGLNPQEIGGMIDLIRKIQAEGVTVLLIEHHMDLVMEISEEITVLDYGKKISEGGPAHVQNDQKVKDAYFGPEVLIDARN